MGSATCMFSPIWLWPSATGPCCSRLISNWLERLKEPVAEAEGSRARDRRCSAPETATNVLPTLAGLAGPATCTRVNGLSLTKRLRGASSPVAAGRRGEAQ
jgi:hypothetical protein